jgi:hypothetical protein
MGRHDLFDREVIGSRAEGRLRFLMLSMQSFSVHAIRRSR